MDQKEMGKEKSKEWLQPSGNIGSDMPYMHYMYICWNVCYSVSYILRQHILHCTAVLIASEIYDVCQ